jgi:NADH-quinone oxidoreductase subunit L
MSFLILIPLLPLAACLLLAVAGRRLGEASHRVGTPAVALSLALSVVAFVVVLADGPQSADLYRFLETGALVVNLGLYVDQLTVVMLLLVTGVSTIVHVYAARYMIGDARYPRFFAVMALFTSAMIVLVMSRNLLMTYMAWEAMGICSYLLISHWADRRAAGQAATKAFLVNAVADLGFGCGVLLTFQTFGTLEIPVILERAAGAGGQTVNALAWLGLEWTVPATTLISLLLFTGAMGKSAQLPLHVWLPFAMEAPTPVSALIHAATMVNAGPFLLIRLSPLFVLAPFAMGVIAIVGAATAIVAGLVSMTQSDIKKILAYSTISQIGFMIMMCGVGAFVAALFHLLAHGFLKAFLFLSTGSSLEALRPHHHAGHGHDVSARVRPRSLMVGTLLFASVPPLMLFAGPYEAMWAIHGSPLATVTFWILGLATVFLTAAYLARAAEAQFGDEFTAPGGVVRPRFLSIPHAPIVFAAALVLAAFLVGFPAWFTGFLAPALAPDAAQAAGAGLGLAPTPWLVLPLLAAVGGWGVVALGAGRRASASSRAGGWTSALYMLFWNKLYVDEIYEAYIVVPSLRLAEGLAARVERGIVERSLNAMVSGSIGTALWLWRVLEGRGLERAVDGTASASMVTARWLWRVLEGRAIQGSVERLSHQADAVGRFFQHREVHTLQEHLLLVVGGLATLLGLFYFVIHGAG